MKQGGTNGSKEESSKEKENHKEESSKEESSEEESSEEESSEEESSEEEKEKISTSIQLVFDKASCPIALCRENKNMGLLFVYHRNSGIIFPAIQLGIISVFPS
ncbi:MAG: hypothetical protein JRI49_00970 [Deltaproteobacteria bacterium]|nr:hypothetical protein [Deltaproteobacteria bacterium]